MSYGFLKQKSHHEMPGKGVSSITPGPSLVPISCTIDSKLIRFTNCPASSSMELFGASICALNECGFPDPPEVAHFRGPAA